MRDHEAAMSVYAQLAAISDQKHQTQVRDRFLVLAGVEACRAGWLEVAAVCHRKLVASNPAHRANRFSSFADALQDEEFQKIVVQLERYCPFEKAEAMFRDLDPPSIEPSDLSIGDQLIKILGNS